MFQSPGFNGNTDMLRLLDLSRGTLVPTQDQSQPHHSELIDLSWFQLLWCEVAGKPTVKGKATVYRGWTIPRRPLTEEDKSPPWLSGPSGERPVFLGNSSKLALYIYSQHSLGRDFQKVTRDFECFHFGGPKLEVPEMGLVLLSPSILKIRPLVGISNGALKNVLAAFKNAGSGFHVSKRQH